MKACNFLIPVVLLLCQCSSKTEPQTYQLGKINIEVSGSDESRNLFEKGLLLLHSFEYSDAREAFQAARQADPDMLMAYWGEAMTHNHSLWHEQDYEEGKALLKKLSARNTLAQVSKLEQDLINAVNVLYEEKKPKNERDDAYARYMANLHEKYPDNQEVAAFYALSLLGSVEEGRDYELYGQGAKIAQGILAENPNHPGALHYLIHSYDDPDHAQLALDAAFSYGEVAPDASHALHMPSHIYVAMGMWDDVVRANERSYQASLNRMERKNLGDDARGYHAFHWLQYGYIQQGKVEKAAEMTRQMQEFSAASTAKRTRVHMVYLKGTYLVETNDWDNPIANITVHVDDLNVAIRSQYRFQQGMKAFKDGNTQRVTALADAIHKDFEKEALLASNNKVTVCSGISRSIASNENILESKTFEWQLRAMKAWLEGDKAKTEYWLQESIKQEEQIGYSYGPPFIQKPTYELYAEWLMEQGRHEEALEHYEKTLQRTPKRVMALKGKKAAAKALGNEEVVQNMEQALDGIMNTLASASK